MSKVKQRQVFVICLFEPKEDSKRHVSNVHGVILYSYSLTNNTREIKDKFFDHFTIIFQYFEK